MLAHNKKLNENIKKKKEKIKVFEDNFKMPMILFTDIIKNMNIYK